QLLVLGVVVHACQVVVGIPVATEQGQSRRIVIRKTRVRHEHAVQELRREVVIDGAFDTLDVQLDTNFGQIRLVYLSERRDLGHDRVEQEIEAHIRETGVHYAGG